MIRLLDQEDPSQYVLYDERRSSSRSFSLTLSLESVHNEEEQEEEQEEEEVDDDFPVLTGMKQNDFSSSLLCFKIGIEVKKEEKFLLRKVVLLIGC